MNIYIILVPDKMHIVKKIYYMAHCQIIFKHDTSISFYIIYFNISNARKLPLSIEILPFAIICLKTFLKCINQD